MKSPDRFEIFSIYFFGLGLVDFELVTITVALTSYITVKRLGIWIAIAGELHSH